MNCTISKISLTSVEFSVCDGDAELNTDVIVRFENGEEYVGTCASFKAFSDMIQSHQNSEQCRQTDYYKIVSSVLVNKLDCESLKPVIEQMVNEGDFQVLFKKI